MSRLFGIGASRIECLGRPGVYRGENILGAFLLTIFFFYYFLRLLFVARVFAVSMDGCLDYFLTDFLFFAVYF